MSKLTIGTGLSQRDMKLSDGRKHFWQWDTGCQLVIIGCQNISEVHYFRQGQKEAMTLKAQESEGKIICDVPDEILQACVEFTAYAYLIDDEGNTTIFSKKFPVKERPKPVDYVYTPTEVVSYTTLDARITALEESGGGGSGSGTDGLSAYEIAVKNGFKGSETEWLESLKGEDGKDGLDGKNGVDGKDGKDGFSVSHGWNGTTLYITSASGTSSADLKGEKGEQGIQGLKGDKGDNGEAGKNGIDGKDGADGITPHIGDNGNWFIGDTDTGKPSQGEKGDPSDAEEIYIGTEPPTDPNVKIWINPNGNPGSVTAENGNEVEY